MATLNNVLRVRSEEAYAALDFTIADLTDAQLHHIAEGGTIGSPASIYFHVAWVDDLVLAMFLRGTTPIYDAGGWSEKLPNVQPHRGPSSMEWARSIRVESVETLTVYVQAVRAEIAAYVAGLTDEDFDREIPFFTGPTSQANVLTWLQWNCATHTGEIAALRGVAGLQGLPF